MTTTVRMGAAPGMGLYAGESPKHGNKPVASSRSAKGFSTTPSLKLPSIERGRSILRGAHSAQTRTASRSVSARSRSLSARARSAHGDLDATLTSTARDGSEYTGETADGLFHGKGKLEMPSGAIYEGQYNYGLRDGKGRFTWADGDYYEGGYKDDLRHGHGVYVWVDGRKYTGEFANNNRHGQGSFTWPCGDRFVGSYENDNRHGPGSLTYASGEVDAGEWRGRYLIQLADIDSSSSVGPQIQLGRKLLQAAEEGNITTVQSLLATDRIFPDIANSKGETTLYRAAIQGQTTTMNILIERGARINALTMSGRSILSAVYGASFTGGKVSPSKAYLRDVALALLKRGADPNASKNNTSVLRSAIHAEDIEMVTMLLRKHADVTTKEGSRYGRSILIDAMLQAARSVRISKILNKWQEKYTSAEEEHRSTSSEQIVGQIIDAGASLGDVDDEGLTCLHIASAIPSGRGEQMVNKFFAQHPVPVDINGYWRGRKTPLLMALVAGNDSIVKFLIKQGVNVGVVFPDGHTALSILLSAASRSKRDPENTFDLLHTLVEFGADPLTLIPLNEKFEESGAHGLIVDQMIADDEHAAKMARKAKTQSSALKSIALLRNTPKKPKEGAKAALGKWKKKTTQASIMGSTQEKPVSAAVMKAAHVRRIEQNQPLTPFCFECGRFYGERLRPFPSAAMVCVCSDKCEMRALAADRLRLLAGITVNGESAVKWVGDRIDVLDPAATEIQSLKSSIDNYERDHEKIRLAASVITKMQLQD